MSLKQYIDLMIALYQNNFIPNCVRSTLLHLKLVTILRLMIGNFWCTPDPAIPVLNHLSLIQWAIVTIRWFDVDKAVMTLSSFCTMPHCGHMDHVKQLYGYLAKMSKGVIHICTPGEPDYSALPEKVTRCLVTGILHLFNQTSEYSKKQAANHWNCNLQQLGVHCYPNLHQPSHQSMHHPLLPWHTNWVTSLVTMIPWLIVQPSNIQSCISTTTPCHSTAFMKQLQQRLLPFTMYLANVILLTFLLSIGATRRCGTFFSPFYCSIKVTLQIYTNVIEWTKYIFILQSWSHWSQKSSGGSVRWAVRMHFRKWQ